MRIHIHLTPKGGRDAIEGIVVQANGKAALRARVRVAPEDGKANAALIALLAKALNLSGSALRLEAGGKSRMKTILAHGDPDEIGIALRRFQKPV